MRYLADVVRACVHGDDAAAVDAAAERSFGGLFDDVCSAYSRARLAPPAPKRAGEFVPGWRLDVMNPAFPYGNDRYFVARAILYSHRIALADPLHFYVQPESGPRTPPATMREDLHKILLYGPLERAGLLVYVNPVAAGTPRMPTDPHVPREQLDDYFRDYLAPTGDYLEVEDWSAEVGPAFLARGAAELELMFGLAGVRNLLDWQRHYAEYVDLYVPEIPMYRNTMEWLMRRDGLSVIGAVTKNQDNAALAALWSSPTPSAEAYSRLTVGDLLAIREAPAFDRWRAALTHAVQALAVEQAAEGSAAGGVDFFRVLDEQHRRMTVDVSRLSVFRRFSGTWGTFGLSVATASAATMGAVDLFPGQSGLAAAAGTAAAMAAGYAQKAPRSVRAALRGPRVGRALDAHFSLFATDG